MTGESTEPNGSDAARNTDEMFVAESDSPRLVKRLELLEVGTVPEGDRIVGRDNEIESLVSNLRPIVRGEPPTPVLISGKTGTGKSLVARHVAKTATNVAEREGLDVADIYVDCSQHSTETRAVCATARSINKTAGSPQDIPLTGLGASQYYTYIWELLEDFNAAVVILDEIDRIQPDNDGNQDNILMQLSRAREAQKTDTNIGIIAISNKLDYPEEMNQRVRSSFGDAELLFPPYDANQLKDIMRAREDAFYDDALESGVIPKAAALAAREHGDARKAIRILKNAGQIAEEMQDTVVRETHLDEAKQRAEADRVAEHVSTQTPHARHILLALALLTKNTEADDGEDGYRTTVVYDAYKIVCEQEGVDPLKIDRVRQLLDEQAFLDIIECRRTGGGHQKGTFTAHRLLKDPDVVVEGVGHDPSLVASNIGI